jgi:hypothetical protein
MHNHTLGQIINALTLRKYAKLTKTPLPTRGPRVGVLQYIYCDAGICDISSERHNKKT